MCRAFLSPWYERGGMHPEDEDDKPVFEGRCNLGVVSLHLPMILAKAMRESKDFYEVLDYYLELIRNLHKRTYDYIGELRASVNPIAFCEGGLLGGYLNPADKIKSILPPMTMSYGITALNELQRLYNGKSIREDGEFALEVMQYINDYVSRIKEEDGILYAIYGTPAESLCFEENTLVQTYDGDKAIKDIKRGDLVYSYNEKTMMREYKKVLSSQLTNNSAEVLMVSFTNGKYVICTPNHKFAKGTHKKKGDGYTDYNVEYVEAKNLKQGDRIPNNECRYNVVKSVRYLENKMPVYDITVEDNHNFYVGDGDGILVHNCGLQVEQFRRIYGIVENVSDKPYVSNSFHCHVSEDMTPIEKQDKEGRFWNMFNGGKIQYCRYNLGYNKEAIKTLVLRAMNKGFYEGVNLAMCYCEDCGYQQVEMDVCPKCGSSIITKIDRMNGYLGFTRVHGQTRYNEAKVAEIADRVSM